MAVRFEPTNAGTTRPPSRTRYQGPTPPTNTRANNAYAARYQGQANAYANRSNNAWAGRYQGQANALARQAQQGVTPGWNEPMNPAMRAAGSYVRGVYNGTVAPVGTPGFGQRPYQLARQQPGAPNPYNVPNVPRQPVTRPRYAVDTWNNDDLVDWIDYRTRPGENAIPNAAVAGALAGAALGGGYGGSPYGGGGGYGGWGGGGGGGYESVPQWYMNLGMWRI